MELYLIRHGMTPGNREKRYIGVTDEPLCEEGIEQLRQSRALPYCPQVFISPLIRCRQTAQILFPDSRPVEIAELAEMNFGIFENRAYAKDLEFSPAYQKWLASMCEDLIPGGESKDAFESRCICGFQKALAMLEDDGFRKAYAMPEDIRCAAFVVHGGTIMSIMHRFAASSRKYYEWNPPNGHGYCAEWDGERLLGIREI